MTNTVMHQNASSVTFSRLANMVPLSPRMTYLARPIILATSREISLGPAIIIPIYFSDRDNGWVLMTICSAPQLYGNHENHLEPIDIEQTALWVVQNKQCLLDFYNHHLDVSQFLERMSKLELPEGKYPLPEYDKAYDWTCRLVSGETGLPRTVYIRPEGGGSHFVFIGEYPGAPANPREVVSITADEDPQVIGFCHCVTEEEISLTRSWILRNLQLLKKHWTYEIDDFEFLRQCQKV